MTVHVLRRPPAARAVKAGRRPQRHRLPRGLGLRGADAGAAPAHALRAAAAARASAHAGGQRRDPRRRAHPHDRRIDASGRRRALASWRRVDDPSTVAARPTDSSGDFSTYTLRLVPAAAATTRLPASTRCSASVDFSFKVECPVRLRLRAALRLPARSRRAAGDRLPRQGLRGFRRLMLDRLSLLAPGWTERVPADVGIAARRTARLRRRPALLPAGRDRDRGLSRHRAPAHLAAPPRPARRLPRARRLQRARVGADVRLRRGRRRRRGHAALDARARHSGRDRARWPTAPRGPRGRRADVRDLRAGSALRLTRAL